MTERAEEDRERERNDKKDADDTCKVFITNIEGSQPEETVEEELRKLFSKYGHVVSLNAKKNQNATYSFAFVQMEKAEEAGKAIQELDQMEFYGKKMRVYRSFYSGGRTDKTKAAFTANNLAISRGSVPTTDKIDPETTIGSHHPGHTVEKGGILLRGITADTTMTGIMRDTMTDATGMSEINRIGPNAITPDTRNIREGSTTNVGNLQGPSRQVIVIGIPTIITGATTLVRVLIVSRRGGGIIGGGEIGKLMRGERGLHTEDIMEEEVVPMGLVHREGDCGQI
jgi:RNA recognition motif-containing protein